MFVITLLSMLLLTLMSLQYLPRMTRKKMMIGRLGLDFLKKVEAPAPLFQPPAVLVASYTYCCCCALRK